MALDKTRRDLLEAAYSEIRLQGFQSASLNAILNQAGVTKGALYHYFKNKKALGYAVLDELILPYLEKTWIDPLNDKRYPPLERLKQTISMAGEKLDDLEIQLGCPLNNLAQEMSSVDDAFRQRLVRIYDIWSAGIRDALRQGQAGGSVRSDIDAEKVALFIVSTLEGSMGMAKTARSAGVLRDTGQVLMTFLEGLRVPA